MLQPVIIAGGSGTRLWPLSRQLYPKQFLPLLGQQTMLQLTLQRLQGLDCLPPIIVCNEEHRFIAAEQLRQVGIKHGGIILEPLARDTAPAICLAALLADKIDSANLLILPADHYMDSPQQFRDAIIAGKSAAEAGQLITFGITPDHPATGYGYIKATAEVDAPQPVQKFCEKPAQQQAEKYVASGDYLWNSGIFLFTATSYLTELELYRPTIFAACAAAWDKRSFDQDFIRPCAEAFAQCPSESIDYAIMEHTEKASLIPMDPGWNDLGSWSALLDLLPKNPQGNVQDGDVICQDSSNNYIKGGDKLVAVVGAENLVIVDTSDALLVAHRDHVENVKLIVEQLKVDDRSEYVHHREVYRPWGKYDATDSGERFQVKRITVKPMAKLSVQMHHHRAEHWVVVRGTAKVSIDGVEKLVSENESVYIPIGAVHSLENPGKINLELIEVQTGSYFGEDDIVRLEDQYGRS